MQKPWGLSEPVPKALTVHTLHHSQSRLAFLSAETLGLSEPVLRAIKRKGYRLPTPIQRKTLPLILQASKGRWAVERGCNNVTGAAAQQLGCSCSQRVLAVGQVQRSGRELPLILQARAVVRGHGTVGVVAAASKQSLRSTQGLERMSCTVWEGSCFCETELQWPSFLAGPGRGGHGTHRLRQAPLLCPIAAGSPSVRAAPLR